MGAPHAMRQRGFSLLEMVLVLALIAGASLLAMAAFTPDRLQAFVLATVAVAFFGATQDIAVDAYRIEIAPVDAQGALVATYSLGYRIGLIIAGTLLSLVVVLGLGRGLKAFSRSRSP